MRRAFIGPLLMAVSLPRIALGIDVTACNTTVPKGETGVVQTDLDCTNTAAPAVRLLRGAVLELNGHTVAGGPGFPTIVGTKDALSDFEPGRFTIRGPGTIAGSDPDPYPFPGLHGCVTVNGGRARLESETGEIDVHGCDVGVLGGTTGDLSGGRLDLDHVTMHDNWEAGAAAKAVKASHVTAHHHARGIGLTARTSLRLSNVSAHHNDVGLSAGRAVKGADVTASDNLGPDPNGAGGVGVFSAGSVNLLRLTASNNTNPGVGAVRVKLVDSTVVNNGLRPPHLTIDIQSERRPRLVNSTCLHSEVTGVGMVPPDWDVCLND